MPVRGVRLVQLYGVAVGRVTSTFGVRVGGTRGQNKVRRGAPMKTTLSVLSTVEPQTSVGPGQVTRTTP